MNEDYVAGFMAKAAELGVDPEALVKFAAEEKQAIVPWATAAVAGATGYGGVKFLQWRKRRAAEREAAKPKTLPVKDYKAMRKMRQAAQAGSPAPGRPADGVFVGAARRPIGQSNE